VKALRELLALIGVLFAVGIVATNYSLLPMRIVTHFNAAGVADGYGFKSVLWLLVGISVASYGMMSIVNFVPPIISSRRPLTVEQQMAVWTTTKEVVGWMKVEMAWLFAYLCYAMVAVARGSMTGLGRWFGPTLLVMICGTMLVALVRIVRAMRVG
jgi:uncharacterized membrane protein